MAQYKYYAEQFLPADIDVVWDFFSSPLNLPKITPPELDFTILTKIPDNKIVEGMEIDYKVRPIWKIQAKWKTLISKVDYQKQFKDVQLKGPYSEWVHLHTFVNYNGGVLMKDEISYRLPFGWLGKIAHFLFVRKQLEYIFDYRKKVIEKIFYKNEQLLN